MNIQPQKSASKIIKHAMRYAQKAIILTMLFCLSGNLEAASRLRDLIFIPVSQPNPNHSHGYVEHRVHITNDSHKNRYKVRLVAPAQSYSWGNSIKSIERTLTIDPGVTVTVTLPQPALQMSGNSSVRVYVNGSDWGNFSMGSISSGFNGHSGKKSALCTRSINGQQLSDEFQNISGNTNFQVSRSELELSEWSSNWLAYSCYDAIFMNSEDIKTLPTVLQETMHQYISAGGVLAIMDKIQLPFGWSAQTEELTPSLNRYKIGFGELLIYNKANTANLNPKQLRVLLDAAEETRSTWKRMFNMNQSNTMFPVVDDMSLPTRGMFFIMLTFAILIGPVMLIVLARKNKRIWLLWMSPLLSFVVCLAVFLFSIFSEGITPSARMESVTFLNQNTHQAITLGMLGLYCPLTPAGGLHFAPHSEISPHIRAHNNNRSDKTINWTRDQNLDRGWVTARVPSYFRTRTPEIRRERLEIVQTDKGTEVINGLGAKIKDLWVVDSKGNWHSIGKPIASGAKGKLIASSSPKLKHSIHDLRKIYSAEKWPEIFNKISVSRSRLLQPNMYLAVLEGAPFMTHGLRGKVDERSKSYVIGILPPTQNIKSTTPTKPENS